MFIQLTQDKYTEIDESDFDSLSKYTWRHLNGYAVRSIRKGPKVFNVYLHRELLSPEVGMVVDHINGNTLDNRRSNLRVCSQAHNSKNRKPNKDKKYKGANWHSSNKKWISQIVIKGKSKHLGYFDTEIEAAKTYDVAAKAYYGEFACLNTY